MGKILAGASALIAGLFTVTMAVGQEIKTFAEFGLDAPPGNLAITPDNRIFMSLHQF